MIEIYRPVDWVWLEAWVAGGKQNAQASSLPVWPVV